MLVLILSFNSFSTLMNAYILKFHYLNTVWSSTVQIHNSEASPGLQMTAQLMINLDSGPCKHLMKAFCDCVVSDYYKHI